MNTQILETLIKLAIQPTKSEEQNPSGQHIAVIDRGFVYVGNISFEGDWMKISDAKNIRVWGTTNGLGQLVNGPLESTKLDKCNEVLVPRKAIISLIPCKGF